MHSQQLSPMSTKAKFLTRLDNPPCNVLKFIHSHFNYISTCLPTKVRQLFLNSFVFSVLRANCQDHNGIRKLNEYIFFKLSNFLGHTFSIIHVHEIKSNKHTHSAIELNLISLEIKLKPNTTHS